MCMDCHAARLAETIGEKPVLRSLKAAIRYELQPDCICTLKVRLEQVSGQWQVQTERDKQDETLGWDSLVGWQNVHPFPKLVWCKVKQSPQKVTLKRVPSASAQPQGRDGRIRLLALAAMPRSTTTVQQDVAPSSSPAPQPSPTASNSKKLLPPIVITSRSTYSEPLTPMAINTLGSTRQTAPPSAHKRRRGTLVSMHRALPRFATLPAGPIVFREISTVVPLGKPPKCTDQNQKTDSSNQENADGTYQSSPSESFVFGDENRRSASHKPPAGMRTRKRFAFAISKALRQNLADKKQQEAVSQITSINGVRYEKQSKHDDFLLDRNAHFLNEV